jgi:sphinganine-1-phosphate aldolase
MPRFIIGILVGLFFHSLLKYLRKTKSKFLKSSLILNNLSKEKIEIKNSVYKSRNNQPTLMTLPENGVSSSTILEEINRNYEEETKKWSSGHVSGTVYFNFDKQEELSNLITQVYSKTFMANPMHLSQFSSINNQEVQIVRWTADLFNGDRNVVGTVTMGGTDSIMEACLSYRKRAEQEYGVTRPVIIIPSSAHISFIKAGDDHKITVVTVTVDKNTGRVDIKRMREAMKKFSRNLIMIAGSAPSYPDGVIDDISELSKLVDEHHQKYGIKVGLHVDCCLGSYVIPFADVRPFDFRVENVTSISVDTHKYGYCPKGSSIILYRDINIAKYQMRIYTQWPGGIYPTPSRLGSRPGGNIACAYAVMLHMGKSGYRNIAKSILDVAELFRTFIRCNEYLRLIESELTVVSFEFKDKYNIYQLAEILKRRYGYEFNKLQFPNKVHYCFTHIHTMEFVETLCKDINSAITECINNPELKGEAAMYCSLQKVPIEISEQAVMWYQEALLDPIIS